MFVWDFHGVLEKDNELAVLEISNRVVEQAGHKKRFSEADNRTLYGRKWHEYFAYILPQLTHEQHLSLQAAAFKYAEDNLHILEKYIKPNDYAVEVLEAINMAGHDQILLSNTRQSDLVWFVNAVGLKKYFPEDKLFGVNAHEQQGAKEATLKSYLVAKQFEAIVAIGDSQADMQVAHAAGAISYFYSHPTITTTDKTVVADYLISDLRAVLKEI